MGWHDACSARLAAQLGLDGWRGAANGKWAREKLDHNVTVNPRNEDERRSEVALESFPFGPSLATFAGRALLAKSRQGLPRPLHPCRASSLCGLISGVG
eukprot:9470664-Pyramimonas_sp.AAC.1